MRSNVCRADSGRPAVRHCCSCGPFASSAWSRTGHGGGGSGRTQELPRARAARRIEAYVYGNVLVLAAIIAAGTADVASGRAALLALGTAASTFIAHLLAMTVGHQAEED